MRTVYIAAHYDYDSFMKFSQVKTYLIYLFNEGRIRGKKANGRWQFWKRDTKRLYLNLRKKYWGSTLCASLEDKYTLKLL